MRDMRRTLSHLLFASLLTASCLYKQVSLGGSGQFVFKDKLGDPEKPIRVWYHKPDQATLDCSVLFVMHGMSRTGQRYRDAWIPFSNQYGFLLVVPEFSKEHYPGSEKYNLGNMFFLHTVPIDEAKWTFSAIEHLFDYLKKGFHLRAVEYDIYGHSAGGQFVHRHILFKRDARVRTAVAANAGWYTLPTLDQAYPYGLKNSGFNEKDLRRAFQQRLIVLLGEKDTDPNHKQLNRTPMALQQGKHRFERGHTFYRVAEEQSRKLGIPLRWERHTVPGAVHSNSQMAPEAARLLYGRRK